MTKNDTDVSFKALAIFSTMRSNLAVVDAFLRKSFIEAKHIDGENDLGFLGVKPGEEQSRIHNQSVIIIVTALLWQSLQNYFDMKRIKSGLEDPDVEEFLNKLGDRNGFIQGMTAIRNGTFHVPSPRQDRRGDTTAFNVICNQRGGVHAVMVGLRGTLYDFTEKCFLGHLKIWPASTYEDFEGLEKERLDLI